MNFASLRLGIFALNFCQMNYLLQASLAAYIVAAIHAWLAFANKRKLVAQVANYALVVGFALHLSALALEAWQNSAIPLFGLRETLSFLALSLVVIYGVMNFRLAVKSLDAFISPLVVLLVFAALWLNSNAAESANNLFGGLNQLWLYLHTTIWVLAYACLLVVFVVSLMYLLQEQELKKKTFGALFHRLPSLSVVNDVATHATFIGFSLLTVGILTGILLSWQKYRSIWHNDPKEILAVLTWILYLFLTIYRISAAWRGRRAAWLGIFGFVLVLLTFFGARMLDSFHAFS